MPKYAFQVDIFEGLLLSPSGYTQTMLTCHITIACSRTSASYACLSRWCEALAGTPVDEHKYKIPIIPYSIMILLSTSPMLLFVSMHPFNIFAWCGFSILSIFYSWYIFVIEIGPDGVRLYRKNMLLWEDVDSVRVRNLFGLRYLFVKRHKGMNYWIPLYFRGNKPIEVSLQKYAPPQNPIASCF